MSRGIPVEREDEAEFGAGSDRPPAASGRTASAFGKDMDLPGLHLHELKGDRKGTWAVSVSGNWRVTFRFEGKDATEVDYEDYH